MTEEHLLDLQSELQGDVSGARRAELLARLRGLLGSCAAAKRQLSDRDAYRELQAASTAVAAAIRIIESLPQRRGVWN